jgi:hypothetical protein
VAIIAVAHAAANVRIPTLRIAQPAEAILLEARPWGVRQEWRDPYGTLIASGSVADDGCRMHWPTVGTFVFDHSAGDVLVHPRPGVNRHDVDDTFVRGVLPIVFLAGEYEGLHASGVEIGGRVFAFCATSGTGKSTLSAAVARQVGTHWADDTVVWTLAGDTSFTVALPFPSRLDAAAWNAVSALCDNVQHSTPGTTATLAALYVVSRVDSGRPVVEIERMPPAAGFKRVLAHSLPFDLSDRDRPRRTLDRLLRLAAQLPVFELRFQPGFEYLPAIAARVAQHARQQTEE